MNTNNKKLDVTDLEIYKSSYNLMLEIHKLTLSYPKIEQFGGIADQLRRSSKSITANMVEGYAKHRFYKDEFKRMLVYSIGSTDETILWIRVSKDLGYIDEKISNKLIKEYKILVRRLSVFTSSIK
ncbi:23S rRNA-intervening sequence protein [Campylobacter sputorum subsp. bovis]|nr:23S rRNA-intervening sequence protein [Campylobacter sputorum]ASM40101.1 23S rRNA-intervening sequence protein [Campylobacter sputorum]ASM40669.1 23S rRNA-intervening sequence protein [Campylobacter sputorum]